MSAGLPLEVVQSTGDAVSVRRGEYQTLLEDFERLRMGCEDTRSREMRDAQSAPHKGKPGPKPNCLKVGDLVHIDPVLLMTLQPAFGLNVDTRTRFEIIGGPARFVATVSHGPAFKLKYNSGPEVGKTLMHHYPAEVLSRA